MVREVSRKRVVRSNRIIGWLMVFSLYSLAPCRPASFRWTARRHRHWQRIVGVVITLWVTMFARAKLKTGALHNAKVRLQGSAVVQAPIAGEACHLAMHDYGDSVGLDQSTKPSPYDAIRGDLCPKSESANEAGLTLDY